MSSAAKPIVCDTTAPNPTEYYGTLVNTNIRYEDGSPVTIKGFLGVKFKAPPNSGITVDVLLNPWQQTSSEKRCETLEDGTIIVTAKIIVESSHTFKPSDKLTWGINGDLTHDTDTYVNSFELYADELPSGYVEIQCADAPDPALKNAKQVIYLEQDSTRESHYVGPGETISPSVVSGNYTVKVDDLADEAQTVVATAIVSPDQITVVTGETTTVKVTYGNVSKYSALNVEVGQLPSPIEKEQLHVTVVKTSTGELLADFSSPGNRKTELRRLPSSGKADINAQITLNNVKYSFFSTISLSNTLFKVSIDQDNIKSKEIDSSGFVDLPISLLSDVTDPDTVISVRLSSEASDLIYEQAIPVSQGTVKLEVPVAPGDYNVAVKGFISDWTVYAVESPRTLTVASDGSTTLQLTARRGANLKVKGFQEFLSFGALSDLVDLDGTAFVAARASSLFKYAGNDGAGDPGINLVDDPATTKTVELAAKIESQLEGDHSVLPIMISYTVNLSLGDVISQLTNETQLAHSFGNLILSLKLAKEASKKPVPAGYIVNPDFLGECQKGVRPDFVMPVRNSLEEALNYRNVDVEVPSAITDTLKGYVFAVNWLIRTVAEEVTFGWQVNLWGVGSSEWVYLDESPAEKARLTANYIKELGVYDSEYAPDFLAIDRYEADDFTQRAYVNSYCYSSYEWGRFFDFCSTLSLELQVSTQSFHPLCQRSTNFTHIVPLRWLVFVTTTQKEPMRFEDLPDLASSY